MRLSSSHFDIPSEIVRALGEIGCKTDTDLLFSSAYDLFLQLPKGIVRYSDFQECIRSVAAASAAQGISGADLLRAAEDRSANRASHDFSSGIDALDEMLGGFGGARVIEISGDKGSGKTILALHVLLRHLITCSDSTALWIDTTGDFTAVRATKVLSSCAETVVHDSVLERLQVSLAFDLDTTYEVLDSARAMLESSPTIHLMVLDTITALLSPLLSAVSSQGHAIMTGFMQRLRGLAQEFGVAILVLNNSTRCTPSNPNTVFESDMKPALGPSFPFLTDATLWLWCPPHPRNEDADINEELINEESTLHVAELLRSKTTTSKTWCTFQSKNGTILIQPKAQEQR